MYLIYYYLDINFYLIPNKLDNYIFDLLLFRY